MAPSGEGPSPCPLPSSPPSWLTATKPARLAAGVQTEPSPCHTQQEEQEQAPPPPRPGFRGVSLHLLPLHEALVCQE